MFLKFEDEVLETDGCLQHNSLKRSEQSCLNDFPNRVEIDAVIEIPNKY